MPHTITIDYKAFQENRDTGSSLPIFNVSSNNDFHKEKFVAVFDNWEWKYNPLSSPSLSLTTNIATYTDPTWMFGDITIPQMTIIHVNQLLLKKNRKDKVNRPPFSIRKGKNVKYAWGVRSMGMSGFMYSPHLPILKCGARLIFCTFNDVVLLDHENNPFDGVVYKEALETCIIG